MAMFVLFAVFVLAATAVLVAGQQGDQSGFVSIDCGLKGAYSGRGDPKRDILYVSDGPYVDGGENHEVAADQANSARDISQLTLRSFPSSSGTRTCYTLPTESGAKYMVRMFFFYGNYDGKATSPSFDLHLGSNYWDTFRNTDYRWSEAIFIAWASWVPVCLVNTGGGTPFVSTVELRPLQVSLYLQVNPDQPISTYSRMSMGANTTTRCPDDPYDRLWEWRTDSSFWTYLSTTETIRVDYNFAVPIAVLNTAIAPTNNNTVLNVFTWKSYNTSFQFMVVLHFTDFQNSQLRQFNVYINDERLYFNTEDNNQVSPMYLTSSWVYNYGWRWVTDNKYNVTI